MWMCRNGSSPPRYHIISHMSTHILDIHQSPCFYHSSKNITYNISHNPHSVPILQIRPLVSRAQARLTLRQSCLPHPGRTVRIGQPIRGPGFPVLGELCGWVNQSADWFRCACQTSYFLWHSCQISRRPTYTSNIILGHKVQSPPVYNTNPSNATHIFVSILVVLLCKN